MVTTHREVTTVSYSPKHRNCAREGCSPSFGWDEHPNSDAHLIQGEVISMASAIMGDGYFMVEDYHSSRSKSFGDGQKVG